MASNGKRSPHQWVVREAESTLAAETTALIGYLTVVQGSIETLEESWDDLEEPARRMLLAMTRRQTSVALDVLKDIQRQLPPSVLPPSSSTVDLRPGESAPADQHTA